MSAKDHKDGVQTAKIRVSDGYVARVIVGSHAGATFGADDWAACLSRPLSLFENPVRTLKAPAGDTDEHTVIEQRVRVGSRPLSVVVKCHQPAMGIRQLFRGVRPSRSVRNFDTAVVLDSAGVPVAAPLAALERRAAGIVCESVFITELVEGASSLYDFLARRLPDEPHLRPLVKSQLAGKVAELLAGLHNAGFWHRDAKASNLLVRPEGDGRYGVLFVDMDGIKRYGLIGRRRCQFRALSNLAASLMPLETVNVLDYLRTYVHYCNLCGVGRAERRRLLHRVVQEARAKRRRKDGTT